MAVKQPAQQPEPTRPRIVNHYRYLGVRPTAGSDEIVEAYLARVDGADQATVARADQALAVLSDPQRRASYDQALAAANRAAVSSGSTKQPVNEAVHVGPAQAPRSGTRPALWLFAALAVLVVAAGFILLGNQRQAAPLNSAALEAQATAAQMGADGVQTLDVLLNGDTFRYEPSVIKVKQGVPTRFNLHVKGDPG